MKAYNFKVKKEYLKEIDLSYYKNTQERSKCERDIIEVYSSDNINIFNTNPNFTFDISLIKEINENFFYNVINSHFFFTLFNKLLENYTSKKNTLENIQINIYKIYALIFSFYLKENQALSERVISLLDNLISEVKEILNLPSNLSANNANIIKENLKLLFKSFVKQKNALKGIEDSSGNIEEKDTKSSSKEGNMDAAKLKAKLKKEELMKAFKKKTEKVNKEIENSKKHGITY